MTSSFLNGVTGWPLQPSNVSGLKFAGAASAKNEAAPLTGAGEPGAEHIASLVEKIVLAGDQRAHELSL
jgi:hypothetical protein